MINDILEKKNEKVLLPYLKHNQILFDIVTPPPKKRNRSSYVHLPPDKYEPVQTESCTALPNPPTDLLMQTDAEIY